MQLKSQSFESMDPINIFSFLPNFHKEFDANGIHEGVSMWWFHYLFQKTTKAELSERFRTKVDRIKSKDSQFNLYSGLVDYHIMTYAEDDASINQFLQSDNCSPL